MQLQTSDYGSESASIRREMHFYFNLMSLSSWGDREGKRQQVPLPPPSPPNLGQEASSSAYIFSCPLCTGHAPVAPGVEPRVRGWCLCGSPYPLFLFLSLGLEACTECMALGPGAASPMGEGSRYSCLLHHSLTPKDQCLGGRPAHGDLQTVGCASSSSSQRALLLVGV